MNSWADYSDLNTQVKCLLKHRTPMAWIEGIASLKADPIEFNSLVLNEISFGAHFPDAHLIEIGAQAFAWLVITKKLLAGEKNFQIESGFLSAIDSFERVEGVKFSMDERIIITVDVLQELPPIYMLKCNFFNEQKKFLGMTTIKIFGTFKQG